jgi:hypothetical protein
LEEAKGVSLLIPVSNSSVPVYPTMAVVATEGAHSTTSSGKAYLGPVREDFSYDLDGNLTADSRWDYTWGLDLMGNLETEGNIGGLPSQNFSSVGRELSVCRLCGIERLAVTLLVL